MGFKLITSFFCSFLLLQAVSAVTYELDDGGEIFSTYKTCEEEGLVCSDCNTLSMCFQLSNGSFITQEFEKCSGENLYCNSNTLECGKDPDGECQGSLPDNFVCYSLGVFPDPFTCRKYHLCIPEDETAEVPIPKKQSLVIQCPTGYGYDVLTSTCRMNLLTTPCSPAIACSVNVTKGAFPKNPAFYYRCTNSYPQVFLCPKSQQFIDGKCQDLPTSKPTNLCTSIGLYADSTDCRVYYECTTIGNVPAKRVCSTQQHFSYVNKKCVDFTCSSSVIV